MQFQLTKEFIGQLKERVAASDSAWIHKNVLELHHADIADVLDDPDNAENIKGVKSRVSELTKKFPVYGN